MKDFRHLVKEMDVPDIVQDIDGKTGKEKDQDKGVY